MPRRHQRVDQGDDVLDFRHFDEACFLRLLGGDAQSIKLGLHQPQTLALARQNHHVLGLQTLLLHMVLQPVRCLPALHTFAVFFRVGSWRDQ